MGRGFAFASCGQGQGELQLPISPFSVVQRRHLAQGCSAQQRKLCQVPFHLDGLLSEHFSSAFLSGGLVRASAILLIWVCRDRPCIRKDIKRGLMFYKIQIVNSLPAVWKAVAATPLSNTTERFGNQDGVRTQSLTGFFSLSPSHLKETDGRQCLNI